jgi:hypothetical protein
MDPEDWAAFEGWALYNEPIWEAVNHRARRGQITHQEAMREIAYLLTLELEETRLKYRRHIAEFGPSKLSP